jgi:cytochrome b subunit of formate dehydrogenase
VSPEAAEGDEGNEPILYFISSLYVLLTVTVVGGMTVHNGLDFLKKIRRKLAMQKGLVAESQVAHRLYVRMTGHERLQHAALMLSFTLLVITGFMLRYPDSWWVSRIGRVSAHAFEWRSWIHRIAGVALIVAGLWHFGYLAFAARGRTLFCDLLPRWLAGSKPLFSRFSYIEKTEYWAMMWGSILMGITGVLLWFENTSMGLFTKLGFDISRTIHFYEAILATLAIVVWHFYFVIFNPDVYPMNLSWLTGRMSEREILDEHPLDLPRLQAEEAATLAHRTPPAPLAPPPAPPSAS